VPPRPVLLGKPLVYLDQSTLSDAFRAHAVLGAGRAADPAYAPLLPWMEGVAQRGNLVLSMAHLSEIAGLPDRALADAIVAWFWERDFVWARDIRSVLEQEAEVWTMRALGLGDVESVRPFVASIAAGFRDPSHDLVGDVLSERNPLQGLMNAARQQRSLPGEDDLVQMMAALRADAVAHAARSDEWREERLNYHRRVAIRGLAHDADTGLRRRQQDGYEEARERGLHPQDALDQLYARDPACLPADRVMHVLLGGQAVAARRRPDTSEKERKKLRGAGGDIAHACIGAAYCDVFTCDAEVSDWLGDLRTGFGFSRQLTVREAAGGAARFVAELVASA
jgi:hypothetical protein